MGRGARRGRELGFETLIVPVPEDDPVGFIHRLGDVAPGCARRQRHVRAQRRRPVVAERIAGREARARVEGASRLEGRARAGLQADPAVAALARDRRDVVDQRAADAWRRPPRRCHRLELGVWSSKCSAPPSDDVAVHAIGEERDRGVLQAVQVQREDVLRRRRRTSELEVAFDQRAHVGGARIVDRDHALGHPARVADRRGGSRSAGRARSPGRSRSALAGRKAPCPQPLGVCLVADGRPRRGRQHDLPAVRREQMRAAAWTEMPT